MNSTWKALADAGTRTWAGGRVRDVWQTTVGDRATVRSRTIVVALVYLVALTLAEHLTVLFNPQLGLVMHSSILVLLILHAARDWDDPTHRMLLTLSFAPLIRLLSLSLPLAEFPLIYWYFLTSMPLFATIFLIARITDFPWRRFRTRLSRVPIQILVGLTGLVFGYVEHQILDPPALVKTFTWHDLLIPAVILFVNTGFFEEVVFRGLMQRAARDAMGRVGIIYVAVIFAVLHIGYQSLADVIFVLGVGLFFGWVVAATKSLAGVTISHGLTNIMLFLVMPFVATGGSSPAPSTLALGTPLAPPATATPAITATLVPTATPTVSVPPTTSPTTVSPTPTLSPQAIVAVDRLNVRAGPSTEDPILTTVDGGTTLDVVGRNAAGDWWRVCCVAGGEAGWVFDEMVTTQGPVDVVPQAEAPPPQAVVNTDGLNVRSGPSTDDPRIGVIYRGERYEITGRNAAGDWWRICCVDGQAGWVLGEFVTVEGQSDRVPIAEGE